MKKYLRLLGTIILAIVIGFVTLIVLLISSLFLILIVGGLIFPPEEPLSEGFFAIPYFEEIVISFVVSYLFSVTVTSFISGYYLRGKEKTEGSYIWWSVVVGFVIGALSFILFYGLLTNARFAARDLIFVSIPSLLGTLGGAAGYYVAGRRYRRRVSE